MNMRTALSLLLLSALLTGCGTSRQLSPIADVHAAIPAGMARIVLARKANAVLGQAVKFDVFQDGKPVGAIAPGGFLAWDHKPGPTALRIESDTVVPLDLVAGKPTCVELSLGSSIEALVVDPGNYQRMISQYDPPAK